MKLVHELIYTEQEIDAVGKMLFEHLQKVAVMTFKGDLGAGKTTLVQRLIRQAGYTGPVQSPTFSYVNAYETTLGTLYHFDLYRLSSVRDFIEAGFAEYLYQPNSKALIEWPEIIIPLLEHDVCAVTIAYEGLHARRLSCKCT